MGFFTNVALDSIQRKNDTGSLIYLDSKQDFNTASVITVAPNEQAIFIKNGEIYGVLPSGRHEVATENYPLLSRIRNRLSGGLGTFTCQVYHVQTNEQVLRWGTASPIEVEDFFLGNGKIGVKTPVRGAAEFRVRFNYRDDDGASTRTFLNIMGDKSSFSVDDLQDFFRAQITQEINDKVANSLKDISKSESINGISSRIKEFAKLLFPEFSEMFRQYGLELINFSFLSLSIEETAERKEFTRRLIAAANIEDTAYNMARQQELLENITLNQGAGGLAAAGAGLGVGVAAGGALASMVNTAFNIPQTPQSKLGTFGQGIPQPTVAPALQPDPKDTLSKMKQLLTSGLITQEQYDAKVAEALSRI